MRTLQEKSEVREQRARQFQSRLLQIGCHLIRKAYEARLGIGERTGQLSILQYWDVER